MVDPPGALRLERPLLPAAEKANAMPLLPDLNIDVNLNPGAQIDQLDSASDASGDLAPSAPDLDAVPGAPCGSVQFGGYGGSYGGVDGCWYSSDGYVYDKAGYRIGTH